MSTLDEARELARRHLEQSLPRRWAHVQGVAGRAADVASRLHLDPDVLVTAAWLHDVGYVPELTVTNFRPIDGARHLRRHGLNERVVCLVAHHSGARIEAEERGMRAELDRDFPREESATADALWYCDLTTGPDGTSVTPTERLAEIKTRYGPDHVVTRFVDRAREELLAAARRTTVRLGQARDPSPADTRD